MYSVRPAGLEPATYSFGGNRSNPLNYGPVAAITSGRPVAV